METKNILDEKETARPSMNNVAFKWALLITLVGIVISLVNLYMNDGHFKQDRSWSMTIFNIAITVAAMYMAGIEYRKLCQDGYMTYKDSFKLLFRFSLFSTLLTLVYMIIFNNLIIDYDTLIAEGAANQIAEFKKKGMSDEQIKQSMAYYHKFSGQGSVYTFIVILGLLMNIVIALLVSIFIKKNPPQFD